MHNQTNGKRPRAILLEAVSSGAQAEDDKESLPEQEKRLRSVAEREDWDIVDTILVPGFSRVHYTYLEFAEAALAEGIAAPMRMFDHWRKKDFDVFACMDGSRFGREQSIFAEVVIRTIDMNAQVFTVRDGYIHKQNYRMYISMGGYSAAGEIDELMRRKAFGMRGRAQKGLPTAPKLVPFLKYVLDAKGEQLGVEVNEDLRRLWDDLAEVVLAGTPWRNVEQALYERYGHVRANGKPYRVNAMYEMLMNPAWWGHDAINHQLKDGVRMRRSLPWVWDESQSVPDGVQVFRHTHPAVYTGELAARVQAELWRRHTVIKGHANPNAYRFTGLLVCDQCGRTLTASKKPNNRWIGWRCMTRYDIHKSGRTCDQTRTVNDDQVQAYLHANLSNYFDGKASALFSASQAAPVPRVDQLVLVRGELDGLRAERRVMIREQARADEKAQDGYREEIAATSEQITILEQREEFLRYSAAASERARADMETELANIEAAGLAAFWSLPPAEVNQRLHRALGSVRIVVQDGDIKGGIPLIRKRGTY